MKIMWVAAFSGVFLASIPTLAADADKGEKVFKKCKACHKVEAGKKSPVGPNLNGVIGRTAGTGDFKRYSKAMRQAGENGLVWDEKALADYLTAPKKFLKGTKMAFPGLKKEKDRDNVIAYLKQFSDQ